MSAVACAALGLLCGLIFVAILGYAWATREMDKPVTDDDIRYCSIDQELDRR